MNSNKISKSGVRSSVQERRWRSLMPTWLSVITWGLAIIIVCWQLLSLISSIKGFTEFDVVGSQVFLFILAGLMVLSFIDTAVDVYISRSSAWRLFLMVPPLVFITTLTDVATATFKGMFCGTAVTVGQIAVVADVPEVPTHCKPLFPRN